MSAAGEQPDAGPRPLWRALVKLARPHQWIKSGFVFIGPFYGLQDTDLDLWRVIGASLAAAIAFALVSSGCYVFNDIADIEHDRAHPRKRRRPLPSGEVSIQTARVYGVLLILAGLLSVIALPGVARWQVLALAGLHAGNVLLYSSVLKHVVIVDVMSLSLGFVLRVIAGCAAVGIPPSTWLLNCIFFLSMFLAFGKRLGERRVMGSSDEASNVRGVQSDYGDDMLRMVVVVTGVATLLTYAGYVQFRELDHGLGLGGGLAFNLLWLTVLPATYCLIRCMTLLERGRYDDPTELALGDWPFRIAAGVFALLTLGLVLADNAGAVP